MNPKTHDFLKKSSLLMAIEGTLCVITAFYLCFYVSQSYGFPVPGLAGLWGAISAIFILNPNRKDVIRTSWMRLWGTIVGSLIPMICVYIFGGYEIYAFAIAVFATILIVSLCGIRDAYKVACITLIVVFVVGWMKQNEITPWANALSRLCESVLGMIVSLIVDVAFYPLRRKFDLF